MDALLIAFECLCLLTAGPLLTTNARNSFHAEDRKAVTMSVGAIGIPKVRGSTLANNKVRHLHADFDARPEGLGHLRLNMVGDAAISSKSKPRPVPKGVWGGEHVGLWVENDSARLEYDCARGTIDRPMKLDSKGRFNATGIHTRESGGPATSGEKPDRHPALYAGQVAGRKMVITVILTDTKETIGTFTLVRGKQPDLYKCK